MICSGAMVEAEDVEMRLQHTGAILKPVTGIPAESFTTTVSTSTGSPIGRRLCVGGFLSVVLSMLAIVLYWNLKDGSVCSLSESESEGQGEGRRMGQTYCVADVEMMIEDMRKNILDKKLYCRQMTGMHLEISESLRDEVSKIYRGSQDEEPVPVDSEWIDTFNKMATEVYGMGWTIVAGFHDTGTEITVVGTGTAHNVLKVLFDTRAGYRLNGQPIRKKK